MRPAFSPCTSKGSLSILVSVITSCEMLSPVFVWSFTGLRFGPYLDANEATVKENGSSGMKHEIVKLSPQGRPMSQSDFRSWTRTLKLVFFCDRITYRTASAPQFLGDRGIRPSTIQCCTDELFEHLSAGQGGAQQFQGLIYLLACSLWGLGVHGPFTHVLVKLNMMLPVTGLVDDIESPLLLALETTQVRCNNVEGLLTIDANTGDLKFTQVKTNRHGNFSRSVGY